MTRVLIDNNMADESAGGSVAKVATLSISVIEGSINKLTNSITQIDTSLTWKQLCAHCEGKVEEDNLISVSLSTGVGSSDFHPQLDDKIEIAHNFNPGLRHVKFIIKPTADLKTSTSINAFEVLMGASTDMNKRPVPIDSTKQRFTAKDRLYNDVVEEMSQAGVGFPRVYTDDMMKKQVEILVDTLWYLDGNKHKFHARQSTPATSLPTRFDDNFNGYNDWRAKKKSAPKLNSHDLKMYSVSIFRMIGRNFTAAWGTFKNDLEQLVLSLDAYAEYLNTENDHQQNRQLSVHPVRQISNHVIVQYIPACNGPIEPKYSILDNVMKECNEYEPVYFDENIYCSSTFDKRMERHRFLSNIALSHDMDILRYDPGGSLGVTVFMWRVPKLRSGSEMMSSACQVVKTLEPRLPEYHTREMRRQFSEMYSNVAGSHIPPHILRNIYAELSLDATSQNLALDNRLRHAILSDDVDMIVDLRNINKGRPDDTFSIFFDQLQKQIESITAADERRHNIEHFSKFISVRDLITTTEQMCPEGTPIPSESTVLFAFVPRNSYTKSVKLYKSRIQLQHKVQTRQLRSAHIDEHYCAAVFSYLKQYAVKFCESSTLVCVDDKSKVDYGEPGNAIASGVRGKKSIVPVAVALSALDHDVGSKGSLTPSVCLQVAIPETHKESFYSGQVHVILKDSIFQPSSPFRHGVELCSILQGEHVKPFLLIYSDGGPDHRLTYGSVKLSLIELFKVLNLDVLIAARTAPGHSWANPAERVMSVLNIAYQNVALYRSEMDSSLEQILKSCNSMADIRKKSDAVKDGWLKSVGSIVDLLNERTERVVLKDKPFNCSQKPATAADVETYEAKVQERFPDVKLGKYTKADLRKADSYHNFVKDHCIERNYTFQIRKCGNESCCQPLRNSNGTLPPVLPDPMENPSDRSHYMPFLEALSKETDESDMPSSRNTSLAKVAEDQQGCQNKMLTGQNVRAKIHCHECDKPRCVYGKKSLSTRDERALKRLQEKYHYSCGSVVTPDGDSLQGTIFTRLQLQCNSPIEFPFYSTTSARVGRQDICCYCAVPDVQPDKTVLKSYRTVLPLCAECRAIGKDVMKRNPIPGK